MRRKLPASPHHRFGGTHLPLRERSHFLHKAAPLLERHLVASTLLGKASMGQWHSLLLLGGCMCAALLARLFFAARHEVMLQLMRLATHCRDTWVWWLGTLGRNRPQLGDRLLVDYSSRPPERRLAASQRSRPQGVVSGTQSRSA